jgi:co-chaperonin GroES (HSP10)
MYNSIYDSVLVEVDGIYDNSLSIKNERGEHINLELPTKSYEDVTEASKRKTSGKVISVCKKISKRIENLSYATLNGFPTPVKAYTYTKEAQEMGSPGGKLYTCGGHEDKFSYNTDIQIKKGDVVHFDYLSLNDQSLIAKHKGKEIHRIVYKNVYAFIREGQINVINGWVLAIPDYVESVQDIEYEGVVTKMQVTKSGIILNHNPKQKDREASVSHIGKDVGWETRDVQIGDNIFFGVHKNKIRTIEGKQFYAIKKDKLMGCIRDGEYVPYGNFVSLVPEHRKEKGNVILSAQYKNEVVRGRVICWGENANKNSEYQKDSLVHFIPKSNALIHIKDKGIMILKEDYIYAEGEGELEVVPNN